MDCAGPSLSSQDSFPDNQSLHQNEAGVNKALQRMEYLEKTVSRLLSDLRTQLDPDLYQAKSKQVELASGLEKLELQEALVHWEVRQVHSSVQKLHTELLHRACTHLKQVAKLSNCEETRTSLELLIERIQEDAQMRSVPLVDLLDEVDSLTSEHFTEVNEHLGKSTQELGTMSTTSQKIHEKIALLSSKCRKDFAIPHLTAVVQNPVKTDIEESMFAQLDFIETSLHSLSKSASQQKAELMQLQDQVKSHLATIKSTQMSTLQVLSLAQFNSIRERQSLDDLELVVATAQATQEFVFRLYEGLRAFNGTECEDVLQHIRGIMQKAEYISKFELEKKNHDREVQMLKTSYRAFEKSINKTIIVILELLHSHRSRDFIERNKELISHSISDEDPCPVLHSKLKFIRIAQSHIIEMLTTDLSVLTSEIANLKSIQELSNNEVVKHQIQTNIEDIQTQMLQKPGSLSRCLVMAETTMSMALSKLKQEQCGYFTLLTESVSQDSLPEVRRSSAPYALTVLGKGMNILIKKIETMMSICDIDSRQTSIDEYNCSVKDLIKGQFRLYLNLQKIYLNVSSVLRRMLSTFRFLSSALMKSTSSANIRTLAELHSNLGLNAPCETSFSEIERILESTDVLCKSLGREEYTVKEVGSQVSFDAQGPFTSSNHDPMAVQLDHFVSESHTGSARFESVQTVQKPEEVKANTVYEEPSTQASSLSHEPSSASYPVPSGSSLSYDASESQPSFVLGPRKKDGTLDMRYKINKEAVANGYTESSRSSSLSYYASLGVPLKKDGTPDMRFSVNKQRFGGGRRR